MIKMNSKVKQTAFTLSGGFIGAGIATYVGLPAPAILGSMLLISLLSFFRFNLYIPVVLRNMAFTAIGCSLGSGITPNLMEQATHWPLSLLGVILMVIVIVFGSSTILVYFYKMDKHTAVLATCPGALSYSLSFAEAGFGDKKAITILQGLRLLLITLGLPLILDGIGQTGDFSKGSLILHLSYGEAAFLMGLVYCVGWMATKINVPAAYILVGLLISGGLHASDVMSGIMPNEFLFVGFTVTGALIGTRFSNFQKTEILGFLGASFSAVLFASIVSALMAYGISAFLNIPFGQVWVAYAPGGVEAMAAMALSLDYDPTYVAAHHVFRIIFLILVLPIVIRMIKKE
jgi:uncharacterized protein